MVACVMTRLLLDWRVFRQHGWLCYVTVARGLVWRVYVSMVACVMTRLLVVWFGVFSSVWLRVL